MIAHVLRIVLTLLAATVLLYISRFWPFDLWSRPGLFGLRELPPGGDALRVWLRGTPFAAFALPIWVCIVFVALSVVERVTAARHP
ncbi:hypothetical protein [Pontivivens insulae]|uniref:Uncharacterized protein n=1 Tax=Pontivivens insulae TaxID=1639689 RepID=A0A2R8AFH3_9RHOB|nr:hypothetical protein [Pontivivens insulae]RED12191.1 hypothetical protein DFR53_2906 [Pontivivens insulae]SPF30947.1 hypothetical protein POI8812_03293 [Pontivivens insulae]